MTLASGPVIGREETAHADVVPPSTAWSQIFDPYTSAPACLDVPGGTTAVNTPLELWHCHGYDSMGTPQRWSFLKTSFFGPNAYIITTQTNLCMGPPFSSTGPSAGTRVVLDKCTIGSFLDPAQQECVRWRPGFPDRPGRQHWTLHGSARLLGRQRRANHPRAVRSWQHPQVLDVWLADTKHTVSAGCAAALESLNSAG